MSTRLGSNARPGTYNWQWSGVNTYNQVARTITLPAGGPWRVSRLGAWLAGKGASASVKLAIWSAGGSVLGASAAFTAASGGAGARGQSASHEADLAAPVDIAGGTTVYIGWTRDPADVVQWDEAESGSYLWQTSTAGAWPGSFPHTLGGDTVSDGLIGAWLYYDLANQPPRAPTLTSPIGGVKTDDSTPDLLFTGSDPDAGDTLATYDIQVSTDPTFASVTHWNLAGGNTGIVGFAVTRTYAGTALTPGATYYWRARTTDNHGAVGPWSAGGSFKYNSAPNAPSLSAPANGYRDVTGSPVFDFSVSDPDVGDTLAAYDIQVSTDSSFVVVSHWDAADQVAGIVDDEVTIGYGGAALTRGTTYYWRARGKDQGGLKGAWSAVRSFRYNALPTVSGMTPSAALAFITNLAEHAIWTAGGNHAKARFGWTPADADGDGLTKYQLRIYAAAVGGVPLWDSGQVALAMAPGTPVTLDVPYALINNTVYYWTITVYDGYEWMVESARTAFKVLWSQGLHEHDTGSPDSSGWQFTPGETAQYTATIFRSATGGGGDGATGKSAWFDALADVPKQQWFQWLVRLSTVTSGSGATLADAAIDYRGSSPVPDGWVVS